MPSTEQLIPSEEIQQVALQHFSTLKSYYSGQRASFEPIWASARNSWSLLKEQEGIYNGRSKLQVPVIFNKIDALYSRISRVVFNREPFGRIEDANQKDGKYRAITEMLNAKMFKFVIPKSGLVNKFKMFIRDKAIEGTQIAKIPQLYEKSIVQYNPNLPPIEIVNQNGPGFEVLALEEFYSDVSKPNINDSLANIHETVISRKFLKDNELRREKEVITVEVPRPDGTTQTVQQEQTKIVGKYFNLAQLESIPNSLISLTEPQKVALKAMGFTNKVEQGKHIQEVNDRKSLGQIKIDECYGLFDLYGDGNPIEVICTIAEGQIVIGLEPTPFIHKEHKRPFIVAQDIQIKNCLYGLSRVIMSLPLVQEVIANRQMYMDAKNLALTPMWYLNTDAGITWDYKIKPNAVIKGSQPPGTAIAPLTYPNLSVVGIDGEAIARRDIDYTFSLSPVQTGTSDPSQIPDTARGTQAIISQNDIPLNESISNVVETLKSVLEIFYERMLTFYNSKDFMDVYSEKELVSKGLIDEKGNPTFDFKDLFMNAFTATILGNNELNNEIARQTGFEKTLQLSTQVPGMATRIDYKNLTVKLMESYGIKEEAADIFLNEEDVQAALQQNAQAQTQQENVNKQEAVEMMQLEENIKADAKIKVKSAEAAIPHLLPKQEKNTNGDK